MQTNNTNNNARGEIVFPELSYEIVGVCFAVHNEIGRFGREVQYANALEARLKEQSIPYTREHNIGSTGNRADFIIDNKIILELKAKDLITKSDYYQIQRYLQSQNFKLGMLVNFRNRYLKPIRIIRIDTPSREKFQLPH